MAVADPLSVPCGVCGAVVREPCQTPQGRVRGDDRVHSVRASAAKRKAKGEGAPHSRPSWLDGKV